MKPSHDIYKIDCHEAVVCEINYVHHSVRHPKPLRVENRGALSAVYTEGKNIEDTISNGIKILKKDGILEDGDRVVLAGGARILPDDESENKVIGGFVTI